MWLLKGKFSSQLVLQLGLFWSSLLHPQWVVLFSCLDHSYRFPLSPKHIWLHVQGFFAFQILCKTFGYLYQDISLPSLALDSTAPLPSLHFVFCFWIKNPPGVWLPCHSYLTPSLSFLKYSNRCFFDWAGTFYFTLFRSLFNEEWLTFNVWAELWECITRPVYSIIYLRLWHWNQRKMPNQWIGPLSLQYIDATKIPISLCLDILKSCFSDQPELQLTHGDADTQTDWLINVNCACTHRIITL